MTPEMGFWEPLISFKGKWFPLLPAHFVAREKVSRDTTIPLSSNGYNTILGS